MSDGDETPGFLARWSRRKRAASGEPEMPDPVPEAALEEATSPRPACPIPNLPDIDLASLPSIEDLTAESDFAAFLRPGVPSLLRQAALRRMWSLDTSIRDYIGPVEYQWDFNAPGGLPFGFASDLGGDLRKLLAQAIGQRDETGDAPGPPAATEEPTTPAPAEAVAEIPPAESDEQEPAADRPAEPPNPPRRRHGGALPV